MPHARRQLRLPIPEPRVQRQRIHDAQLSLRLPACLLDLIEAHTARLSRDPSTPRSTRAAVLRLLLEAGLEAVGACTISSRSAAGSRTPWN